MSLVLDISVPVIVALTAFIGYRRGFVRGVIKLLGTIVCIIFSLIVSDALSGAVYNNIVAPALEKSLTGEMSDFDVAKDIRKSMSEAGVELSVTDDELRKAFRDPGSISAALEKAELKKGRSEEEAEKVKQDSEKYFERGFASTLLEKAGFKDADEIGRKLDVSTAKAFDLIRAFAGKDGIKEGVHYLVYNVIDGMVISVIRFVLFVILLIVTEIIVAIIFKLAGVFDHLPAIKSANKALGLMLGIIKGFIYVVLLALLFSALCKNGAIGDSSSIEDSYVFGFFFRLFY